MEDRAKIMFGTKGYSKIEFYEEGNLVHTYNYFNSVRFFKKDLKMFLGLSADLINTSFLEYIKGVKSEKVDEYAKRLNPQAKRISLTSKSDKTLTCIISIEVKDNHDGTVQEALIPIEKMKLGYDEDFELFFDFDDCSHYNYLFKIEDENIDLIFPNIAE